MSESNSPATALEMLSLPAQRSGRAGGKWMLALASSLVLSVLCVGIIVLDYSVRDEEASLLGSTSDRLQVSATGRAEVLSEWLKGRLALAEPISESDLFLLFAAEVDLAGPGSVAAGPLGDQLAYMQASLAAFQRQAGLLGAYLANRDGVVYAAGPDAPSLVERQREAVKAMFPEGRATILPLRESSDGLVLDLLVPLHPPQSVSAADAKRTVGVLVMTLLAERRIKNAMAPSSLANQGEVAHLLQLSQGRHLAIRPGENPALAPTTLEAGDKPRAVHFDERAGIDGRPEWLSVGVVVSGAPWVVLEEIAKSRALEPLGGHRLFGGLIVVLSTIGFAAAALAFWWRQGSETNRAMARQYHELAGRLQTQRQLLDSINASIQEHITVKDADAKYIYANPAFARVVGLPLDSLIGLTDRALFQSEEAEQLAAEDAEIIAGGEVASQLVSIDVAGVERQFQLSKGPFLDDEGRRMGVVSVARDITEVLEAQRLRETAVMNTIHALSNTIEAVDPYLSGHSRKLERVASGIGRVLGLSDPEIATLEIAANLSQIGKLSVPAEILTKSGRLTEAEKAEIQDHIRHADRILGDLEFGLPVREVMLQMHERLDGSGYPLGLAGDAIDISGRILGVADVFVARTNPRSYRDGARSADILEILTKNQNCYDIRVIEALTSFLAGDEGAAIAPDGTQPSEAASPEPE